jgi:hypothetical protein
VLPSCPLLPNGRRAARAAGKAAGKRDSSSQGGGQGDAKRGEGTGSSQGAGSSGSSQGAGSSQGGGRGRGRPAIKLPVGFPTLYKVLCARLAGARSFDEVVRQKQALLGRASLEQLQALGFKSRAHAAWVLRGVLEIVGGATGKAIWRPLLEQLWPSLNWPARSKERLLMGHLTRQLKGG